MQAIMQEINTLQRRTINNVRKMKDILTGISRCRTNQNTMKAIIAEIMQEIKQEIM